MPTNARPYPPDFQYSMVQLVRAVRSPKMLRDGVLGESGVYPPLG